MSPVLEPGRYAFVTSDADAANELSAHAISLFREAEGLSLIVPISMAPSDAVPMRLITLRVHSSLEGVGLTAAVSSALAAADIPCNVVAAYHHDHIFVPEDCAERAVAVLRSRAAAES